MVVRVLNDKIYEAKLQEKYIHFIYVRFGWNFTYSFNKNDAIMHMYIML